ncbi:dTDP-4-dehydrorhamnose reductase [Phaeodactylibacter luteus]|uniref:dTDP-4-dehydrorhamnose reductase n=1 Tax=Phaeodactylibacter luteus TaxID=1564516 RepID=A0A5C6RLS9_9BACT|nr:dTDP-4-dehydrorhamnose reductase [Phaeodactylibacter luteus]TXB62914.1 dTDP-4-dehydrorhamnose reductase [Phaeodactylibacter luteus]
MAKILVTGANGQLGKEFQVLATTAPGHQFLFANRAILDITQAAAVSRLFKEQALDYCINCAAYTAVDKAESEPALAKAINEDAARNLAEACAAHAVRLIHFSSDYVYHNGLSRPLREDDPTEPKGVYAQTKLAGDEAVLSAHDATMVLRTSWVYSSFGHNFVKTMLRLGKEKDELRVVDDQIGSPTYARSLADACLRLIATDQLGGLPRELWHGVYHYSNEGQCSWHGLASKALQLASVPCTVRPIPTAGYPTPARRPPYSVLDKSRFREAFRFPIPHWEDDLKRMLALL